MSSPGQEHFQANITIITCLKYDDYSNIMIASFSIVLIGNLNPVFTSLRMQQGIFRFVY
jgi:hypothetical protein